MPDKSKLILDTKGGEPVRLLALSDGLFATVLTILVLDLKLELAPDAGPADFTHSIALLWPHLFSYVLTFLVTGLYWLGHHRNFDHIVHYDRRLLWYNLMFLLFVGLLPFTTSLIQGVNPVLWSFYALNMVFIGLILALIWGYSYTHGLVDPEIGSQPARYLLYRQLAAPAVFLLSAGIGFLSPAAYLAQYALLTIPVITGLMDRWHWGKTASQPGKGGFPTEWLWSAASLIPLLLLLALAYWMYGRPSP
jgi:uncharacterized membrane protein